MARDPQTQEQIYSYTVISVTWCLYDRGMSLALMSRSVQAEKGPKHVATS